VEIDYITATNGNPLKWVEIPEGAIEEKSVAFNWGGAEYSGHSKEYPDGHWSRLVHMDRGVLYRVSGALANRTWGLFPIGEFRWSRVDIKEDTSGQLDLLHWYTRQQQEYPRMSASIINGETLYIGSRKSERFWRIYDKTKQMGMGDDIPRIWRVELELKGERGWQAQDAIFAGQMQGLYHGSCIGVMRELLDGIGITRDGIPELDLAIPRKPKAGHKFLEKSVLPFLRANKWAADIVWREIENGDM